LAYLPRPNPNRSCIKLLQKEISSLGFNKRTPRTRDQCHKEETSHLTTLPPGRNEEISRRKSNFRFMRKKPIARTRQEERDDCDTFFAYSKLSSTYVQFLRKADRTRETELPAKFHNCSQSLDLGERYFLGQR